MARFNPHHDPRATYNIVELWRERCLLSDSSLLSDEEDVWSAANVQRVLEAFASRPDDGPDPFLKKLERQLSGLGDSAIQLAAEALYLMLLFPSNIRPPKKRENLRAVLAWRSEPSAPPEEFLTNAALDGIGSTGMGYNQRRPLEFKCFLEIIAELKTSADQDRRAALDDPWAFARLLTKINSAGLQTPHILEHLLFPDTFERISSGGDKGRLIIALSGDDPKKVKALDREARDRRLVALRADIAAQRGNADFDFYEEEFAVRWRPEGDAQAPGGGSSSVWAEVTSIEHGHGGPNWELGRWLWSPTTSKDGADRYSVMRQPGSGERVFHFVAGLMPGNPRKRFLWGRSRVSAPALETADRPSAPGAWGEAEAYYKIELDQLEQLDPPIPMDQFEAENEGLILDDLEGRPKHYPYIRYGEGFRGAQGIYLSKLTPGLEQALDALFDGAPADIPSGEAELPFDADALLADVFLAREEVEDLMEIWRAKKNIILQGAPGVGKSFIAKRLAYLLMKSRAPDRVAMVQFHQSYAYEDFVQGYRPNESRAFDLRDGLFLRHCEKARRDPTRDYVLIIDEINRGNLSKIFGELMLLIEHDKRGPDWKTSLAYARPQDEPFCVPSNLFIIGMMNTADRSLSMVDYALRRRFAFWTLRPQFGAVAFRQHLLSRGAPTAVVDRIVQSLVELNQAIASDSNLGPGFEIGHSFFVPGSAGNYGADWFERVIRTEIVPLLNEYWFDDERRASQWSERLITQFS